MSSEDAGYPQQDEKTLGALLQSGIEFRFWMCSVAGSPVLLVLPKERDVNETPVFQNLNSNPNGKNIVGQCLAGSFCGAQSS